MIQLFLKQVKSGIIAHFAGQGFHCLDPFFATLHPFSNMAKRSGGNPLDLVLELLPNILPCLLALAVTSLVVVTSNTFRGARKIAFQSFVLVGGLTGALTYLLVRKDEYKVSVFFRAFAALPDDIKVALSVAVIVASYFGAAFYVGGPAGAFGGDGGAGNMPASVDRNLEFSVPASLPADEKDFFNFMLDKLTDEILADLPTVYEMNGEAVDWIKTMIDYNVAGGKMNRGLAVVSVQQTFARSKGRSLTNRERCQAAALGWCVEFLQVRRLLLTVHALGLQHAC